MNNQIKNEIYFELLKAPRIESLLESLKDKINADPRGIKITDLRDSLREQYISSLLNYCEILLEFARVFYNSRFYRTYEIEIYQELKKSLCSRVILLKLLIKNVINLFFPLASRLRRL